MIRVLFADDEDMIRTTLATLLDLEEDIDVIASVGDGTEAVAKALELEPDVCLLDLEMPGHDGVEAAERITEKITAKTIIVTRHARPGVLRRAMAAGVAGFVTKSTPASELAEVIRAVADGKRHVDPDIAASALTAERTPLTDRELDVLRIGRDAATVQDIARQLHLAPRHRPQLPVADHAQTRRRHPPRSLRRRMGGRLDLGPRKPKVDARTPPAFDAHASVKWGFTSTTPPRSRD